MIAAPSPRLPVTVVTGFLGAGKTTLLRHLLLRSGQRLAVLVNEFGDVGIDGDLIAGCGFCPAEERSERVVELTNGCLCCTVQEDFLPTMEGLLRRRDRLDGIVVETSGLALPAPLVAAFGWPSIRARLRVQAVVTVVDGEALAAGHVVGDAEALEAQRRADPSLDHLNAIEDLFEDQLRAADLVLVSRADALSSDALTSVLASLAKRLRPGTGLLAMERGRIDPALVLDASGIGERERADHDDHDHSHDPDDPHDHSHGEISSLLLRREGEWSRAVLEPWLRQLIRRQPVLRLKGHLREPHKALPLQIQAVGPRLECWYEAIASDRAGCAGLELVLLTPAAAAADLRQELDTLPEPGGPPA